MLNRLTTTLLVLELILIGVFVSTAISRAIDLNEVGLSRPGNLDINSIQGEGGLDGEGYGNCDESFYDVNGIMSGLNNAARSILADAAKQGLSSMVGCIADNLAGKLTVFGGRVAGGGVMECVKVAASDSKAELRAQLNRRLQANNMASCVTATGNAAVNDTVTAMLHTQGPDGGPAYVTDYNEWLNIRPEKMAQRRMWSILANANLCPQFADAMMDAMRVPQSYRDNPPPLGANGLAVDGGTPPALQWQCTLPEDYTGSWTTAAEFREMGGIDGILLGLEDQNNPLTLLRMIQAEYRKQVEAAKEVNANIAAGGGGFLPVMSECAEDPEGGDCYQYGTIKQVPGSTRDIVDSNRDALQDEWNRATGEQGAVSDISKRIRVQLLDLANAPLTLELEAGPETRNENYRSVATSTPDPNRPAPTPDPTDPACFTNPACECPPPMSTESLRQQIIMKAMREFPPIHSGLEYLYDLCDKIEEKFALDCHPHPTLHDRIVFDFTDDFQVSIIVLLPGGIPRLFDGGSASALCTDGSM